MIRVTSTAIETSCPNNKIPTTPHSPNNPATLPVPAKHSKASSPPVIDSPKNPWNRHWIQEQERRLFLHHLKQWSLKHDSSPHFQGKISLLPPDPKGREEIGLGKSVRCILTDTAFTDARKRIVVRLFPPQKDRARSRGRRARRNAKDRTMDSFITDSKSALRQQDVSSRGVEDDDSTWQSERNNDPSPTNGYYKLVIRCGSGWLSAREYFNKLHLSHLSALLHASPTTTTTTTNRPSPSLSTDTTLAARSRSLGPPPPPKDTITITPLFHPFLLLPPELQDQILITATGLTTRTYNLCPDKTLYHQHPTPPSKPPITIPTMLRLSKQIHATMSPYLYHSTTFHFGLTGLTHFLWRAGPTHRPQIRRLAFHFGKLALLHVIRWLAPDPVFDLLEPPVVTSPSALKDFWRCQVRELAQQVCLDFLLVDIQGIPDPDLGLLVRVLGDAFGGTARVAWCEGEVRLGEGDGRVKGAVEKAGCCWRVLVREYLERYRGFQYFVKADLVGRRVDEVEALMDAEAGFFDS
ncbi:hypothetical protein BDW02DRAFT_621537 [Decorospora gaudefroyi]|uniref:F-box domain-containing protein n=1 Tax=Decorospora gaudefroyi TaxID=184978 RepID=A0A6A5KRG2_9PLEO|nr:hypothetical protein BDW02DRAFT_621537 [Decorospora gaudefroyi]